MIDFKIGDKVTYIPRHAQNDAWRPDNLQKGDQTFECHDSNNSILDGAFGRCESVCNECKRPFKRWID